MNTSHEDELDCVVTLDGLRARGASAQVLSADVGAYNDFSAPSRVAPRSLAATLSGEAGVRFTLPRAAVAKVSIELA